MRFHSCGGAQTTQRRQSGWSCIDVRSLKDSEWQVAPVELGLLLLNCEPAGTLALDKKHASWTSEVL